MRSLPFSNGEPGSQSTEQTTRFGDDQMSVRDPKNITWYGRHRVPQRSLFNTGTRLHTRILFSFWTAECFKQYLSINHMHHYICSILNKNPCMQRGQLRVMQGLTGTYLHNNSFSVLNFIMFLKKWASITWRPYRIWINITVTLHERKKSAIDDNLTVCYQPVQASIKRKSSLQTICEGNPLVLVGSRIRGQQGGNHLCDEIIYVQVFKVAQYLMSLKSIRCCQLLLACVMFWRHW